MIRPREPHASPVPPDKGEGIGLPPGLSGGEAATPGIRPLTRRLIHSAVFDAWPDHAAIVDFGIDSDRHLGALHHAIPQGLVTPEELDAAIGQGEKLTEIARRGRNPHGDFTFRTAWDDMPAGPPIPGEAGREQDGRSIALLFAGAPMPRGWELPAPVPPAGSSDPDAILRAGERIADLKPAVLESWRDVPSDLPARVVAPGRTGGWDELTELGKLDLMQHWVDREGVGLRDRARLLAEQLDVARLPEKVRDAITSDAGAGPVAPSRGKPRDKDPGFGPEL